MPTVIVWLPTGRLKLAGVFLLVTMLSIEICAPDGNELTLSDPLWAYSEAEIMHTAKSFQTVARSVIRGTPPVTELPNSVARTVLLRGGVVVKMAEEVRLK